MIRASVNRDIFAIYDDSHVKRFEDLPVAVVSTSAKDLPKGFGITSMRTKDQIAVPSSLKELRHAYGDGQRHSGSGRARELDKGLSIFIYVNSNPRYFSTLITSSHNPSRGKLAIFDFYSFTACPRKSRYDIRHAEGSNVELR